MARPRAELVTAGASLLKLGLSGSSDLQLGLTPYARLTVSEFGQRSRASGFGDLTVRYKHRLTAASSPLQVGAIAFVKLPTAAHGLGNRKVEGGLAIPASFAAGGPLTLTLGPELDLLADADGKGRHLALANVVNLSAPVAPRLTIAGELWTNLNFDPAGTAKQASADAAFAYLLSNDCSSTPARTSASPATRRISNSTPEHPSASAELAGADRALEQTIFLQHPIHAPLRGCLS